MPTTRITHVFQQVRDENRTAFMPFLTAGDPDLSVTSELIQELSRRGVDLIEVGFPYSDPIADGPVIQSSYTRALAGSLTIPQIFRMVESLPTEDLPPLVAMVSFALIYRRGIESFLRDAKGAGFSGLIVPDLPGDEAEDLFRMTQAEGLDLIQLIAPTTPRERVRKILAHCSGFVYCIAVAGTTGEREKLSEELLNQLKWLPEETGLPLAVGFGISQPEHVDPLRGLADGVIVGSGIVRRLQPIAEGTASAEKAISSVGEFAESMVARCHLPRPTAKEGA